MKITNQCSILPYSEIRCCGPINENSLKLKNLQLRQILAGYKFQIMVIHRLCSGVCAWLHTRGKSNTCDIAAS